MGSCMKKQSITKVAYSNYLFDQTNQISNKQRPFKNDQATVTFYNIQEATLSLCKNDAVTILNQIKEDEKSEDDFCEPTEMPLVHQNANITKNKYITSNNQAFITTTYDQNNQQTPLTVKDLQQNYVLSEDGKALYLKGIAEFYQSDFKDNNHIMIRNSRFMVMEKKCTFNNPYESGVKINSISVRWLSKRCIQHQNILQFQQSEIDNQQMNQESQLINYLKMYSKQYQNVISINQIARGGQSIIFKLDYVGIDEVVIKQSVTDTNNNIDEVIKQSILTNQLAETQQLKLLQSDKFIAQVKEEIIEYDFDNNIIKNYLVIVERARFSLFDLLKIWNNQELSDRFYECYSPEKLAYYFYQTIQLMAYLHQRDMYYGDMKPHNLLVFKDQLIKIGDLGTTIKLDHNIQEDEKSYLIKGLSLAYQDLKTFDQWRKRIPQSKIELFNIDKYSLIRTFE
eukprot:403351596